MEPEQLAEQLSDSRLMILDISTSATYQQVHIPGAIHIAPAELTCGIPPATGKLPTLESLNALFSRIGYEQDRKIMVYDDEGGGWAGRLIWTLDLLGHKSLSYLNGGLHAWLAAGLPLQKTKIKPQATATHLQIEVPEVQATAEDIMEELGGNVVIWDARSPGEFDGSKQFAKRAGHIPGAINFEWTEGMDSNRNYRLKNDLATTLNALGLGQSKNIITHCQTHHRSGFTYLVARILGYKAIRAYDGSWSEWGNRSDTPITMAKTATQTE